MEPLRIFIGWDSKEPEAYHVLVHSIISRASVPITIAPLVQAQLRAAGLYTRERGPTESTEFSMTRFLVPHLAGYKGQALFMDCDMLCLADIARLFEATHYANRPSGAPRVAVHVVQHDYTPSAGTKFLGQQNVPYPRKNWSSLMMFDCDRCAPWSAAEYEGLTPAYVNRATGLELHRLLWAPKKQTGEELIGAIGPEWNYLVGEQPRPSPSPKIVHYTLGGPWFDEYRNCDFAEEWRAERDHMHSLQAA